MYSTLITHNPLCHPCLPWCSFPFLRLIASLLGVFLSLSGLKTMLVNTKMISPETGVTPLEQQPPPPPIDRLNNYKHTSQWLGAASRPHSSRGFTRTEPTGGSPPATGEAGRPPAWAESRPPSDTERLRLQTGKSRRVALGRWRLRTRLLLGADLRSGLWPVELQLRLLTPPGSRAAAPWFCQL